MRNCNIETPSSNNNSFNGAAYLNRSTDIFSESRSGDKYKPLADHGDYSDEDLVKMYVSNNDELAFNELVNRYCQKIYSLAIKMLKDIDTAEDAVQDVLLILLTNLSGFRGDSKFSTWLYAITLNTIRSRIKSRIQDKKSISVDNMLDPDNTEEHIFNNSKDDWSKCPQEISSNKEFLENLNRTLEIIPDIYKTVFVLRDIKQFSNLEVAEQLGLSLSAAKSRISRARRSLRLNLGSQPDYKYA